MALMAGFRNFDSQGNLLNSITDRMTMILGTITTGTTNGSIIVPQFEWGEPFYMGLGLQVTDGLYGPRITISGTTLSWNWENATRYSGTFMYGIF